MDTEQPKYARVNGAWPEGTNEGRAIKPSPQEALAGARRLYRIAFKRPFRGKMKLTSGRRYTYIRRGVFFVNPDQGADRACFVEGVKQDTGGGWHEIVHGISHYACARLYPKAKGHGPQHAFIERELIEAVVAGGWLDGALKRPEKPKADPKDVQHRRDVINLARWRTKKKRAETAIKKLERRVKRHEAASAV